MKEQTSHVPGHAGPTTAAPRHPQPQRNTVADGAIQHEHTPIIRTLQQNLNMLGATDSRGRTLQIDGDYGSNTRAAVSRFQEARGLPVTGVADNATLGAVQAHVIVADLQRQKAAREAAQLLDAPLAADLTLAARETATLHASLHPEQSQRDAVRTTYAATSPATANEISATQSPRRAPDMPDHHAGLGGLQVAHTAIPTARAEHAKSPLDLLLERAHHAALSQDDYALGSVARDFRQSSHGREWEQQQHDYSQTQRQVQEAALAQQQSMGAAQPQRRGWSR